MNLTHAAYNFDSGDEATRHPIRRSRGFWLGMALLCSAIAVVGFVPVYFGPVLRGTATFPLRLHLHAAAASLWLLLLITQTGLIWSGRPHVHMRVGIAALVVAGALVPLTLWAIAVMVTRSDPPGALERAVFFPQVASLVLFAAWVIAGFLNRHHPERHKRFMLMATVALLGTPIARIDLWGINEQPLLMLALWLGPALIVVFYDVWIRRRVHWVTGLCLALLLAMQLATVVLMENEAWGAVIARLADTLRS
jgi:FtsH-binding integral membrane protein